MENVILEKKNFTTYYRVLCHCWIPFSAWGKVLRRNQVFGMDGTSPEMMEKLTIISYLQSFHNLQEKIRQTFPPSTKVNQFSLGSVRAPLVFLVVTLPQGEGDCRS